MKSQPRVCAHAVLAILTLDMLQFRQGIQIDLTKIETENAEAIFAQVQQVTQVSLKAIDMLALVDVSGSMNEM